MNVLKQKHYVTATVIDPRYKTQLLKKAEDQENAKALLLGELLFSRSGDHDSNNGASSSSSGSSSPQENESAKTDLFSTCFDEIAGKDETGPS